VRVTARSVQLIMVVLLSALLSSMGSFDFALSEGGHDSLGAPAPVECFYFAEGTTREGFTTYIAVMNPNDTEASVQFTYMMDSGEPIVRTHEVAPRSRYTLDLSSDVGSGRDVSTEVMSSLPVVVERPMYFRGLEEWTVCLDPGHSGRSGSEIDPATGLNVGDNMGAPGEIEAMWDLALKTKEVLERAGFEVKLAKSSPYDYVSLRSRADIGNTCSIMVRLHYDPGGYEAIMRPPVNAARCPSSDPARITVVDPSVAQGSNELALFLAPYLRLPVRDDTGGTSRGNSTPAGHPTCLIGSVLSRVPVVCIENKLSLARDASGRSQIALELAAGVEEYFKSR